MRRELDHTDVPVAGKVGGGEFTTLALPGFAAQAAR